MVNKVFLIGNLGRDPEVRTTPSGQPVATFTLATNRRWTDKAGQRQEQTEWHTIVCWGRQAEIAGQYLQKGRQIFVEGRLQTRSWDDQRTGEKRYRTEVVCDNFQMLGQRGDHDSSQPPMSAYERDREYAGEPPAGGGSTPGGAGGGEPEDDDIPF